MYILLIIYHGLFAMLAQLVILRELSIPFLGNELFLGTFLSSWLFWLGIGSLCVKHLLKPKEWHIKYFSYSFLILSVLLIMQILLIRLSQALFSFGSLIGPLGTVLFTFASMSVFCFVVGAQFTIACKATFSSKDKDVILGRVYLYETIGAVAGGILFTYVLIGNVPIFTISLALSLGCIISSLVLIRKELYAKKILLISGCLLLLLFNFKLEHMVNKIQWKGYELISRYEARNANLVLTRLGSIKNVFIDGTISASFPNVQSYEPIAHWPLLISKNPEKILVIGEAGLGLLKEVLKHNPDSVDYVIFDRAFIDFIEPNLERLDILALEDKRVNIHYLDGRLYIKNTDKRYDTIILDTGAASNLKLNRFYTQEFYRSIKSRLKSGGIFSFSIASSENYLYGKTRIFNLSVYKTLKSVFSNIEIIPGDNIIFLASPSNFIISKDTIIKRLQDRYISNAYAVSSYFEYKLTHKRRIDLKRDLENTADIEVNSDFRPKTYYYFTNLWQTKFASGLLHFLVCIFFLILARIIFKKRKSIIEFFRYKQECVLIFILGFIGILLELILMLAYQVISGFIYWQMGLLFAAFMLGLFLGGRLGVQLRRSSNRKHFSYLVGIFLSLIILSMCLKYYLPYFINFSNIANIFIFSSLLILIGVLIGCAFVVASFLMVEDEIMHKAGSLYSSDLWGGAMGALLTGNIIVPFLGLLGALNFAAAGGFIGLVVFCGLKFRLK